MKIQNKISLLFFTIGTIGLVMFHVAIFYFVSEFNFDDFFKRLEARSKLAAEINIYTDERSADYQEMRTRYLSKMEDEKDYIFHADSLENASMQLPEYVPLSFFKDIVEKGSARYNKDNRFYYGRLFRHETGNRIVVVSASDPSGFEELNILKKVLIIVFVISVLLTYIASRIFSYYMVRPLTNVIGNVKSISANNLHLRLEELKGNDEMAELVLTFNDMLNRLETAFSTQNNFVSNASHELKTPIAVITAETELMLARKDISPELRSAAERVLDQSERLGHIITSLLGLAQTGFDGKKQNWQRIRVDEMIIDVADSVKKILPESTIQIDFSQLPKDERLLEADGNVNLLQLAVSNIVLNGCKYSNYQPVDIRFSNTEGRIVITITDKGIGIPQSEQPHIFEPFFRASNTGKFDGHGIGLPLTLNIIRLHKGTIGIRSKVDVGTEIQIILPAAVS